MHVIDTSVSYGMVSDTWHARRMTSQAKSGGRPREAELGEFGRRLDYLLSLPENVERYPLKKQFLAKLPVEPPTIRNYEIGERDPSGSLVALMADLLGTTTDYLLGRTDDPRASASAPVPEPAPYPAYLEFLASDYGSNMTDDERAMLRSVRLPPGANPPTVELYVQWLAAYRLAQRMPPAKPPRRA